MMWRMCETRESRPWGPFLSLILILCREIKQIESLVYAPIDVEIAMKTGGVGRAPITASQGICSSSRALLRSFLFPVKLVPP